MTTDKARKRAVRTRTQKTGERYAAARRHVAPPRRPEPEPVSIPDEPAAQPSAGDPGWPDETIIKGTGRAWAHWLALLDDAGAMERSHTEIARWLVATQDITGWWAQMVTVGYERARGRRAVHQTKRGFEVSVSKTIRAPLATVWAVVTDPALQPAWIDAGILEPTTVREGVRARFLVAGGPITVEASFDPRAEDRTTVTVTVRKLQDREDVERQRAVWRERSRRLDLACIAPPTVAPPVAPAS